MLIVHTACSHAVAGESNEARETLRSGEIRAKGVAPLDGEGVSPNPERGELDSASLHQCRWPTSRRWRSLLPAGKQWIQTPAGPTGVIGVSAHRKNDQNNWETRADSPGTGQPSGGKHNLSGCSGRESEGLIVALKRGNSRGAKEPCCKHANIK